MKTPTEEVQYLGQMLAATTGDDAPRLLAISKRVAQIAGANPGTVTDQDGNVHLVDWRVIGTAPQEHGMELLLDDPEEGSFVGYWNANGDRWQTCEKGKRIAPTHWQPLNRPLPLNESSCPNCEHPGPETFQNGAWRCPECFGMGWVPSNTHGDTDPCPKCEGGFSSPK